MKTFGEIAYEAWCEKKERPLVAWSALPKGSQDRWEHVALETVKAAVERMREAKKK